MLKKNIETKLRVYVIVKYRVDASLYITLAPPSPAKQCFASGTIPSVPLPDRAGVRDDTDDPNGAIWADAFVILPGGTTFEVMGPSTLESFVQWDLCGPFMA